MPTLLHDNCSLHYTLVGRGDPVVFLQGVGVHGDGWRPQVEALFHSYQCLTCDNRGMAQSQPANGPLTIEQMASDVLALMDTVGFKNAHLVGHSMGGLIALEMAQRAKSRVRSLSMLCTFADGSKSAPLSLRMMILGLRSRVGTRAMRRRGFLKLICSPAHFASINPDTYAAQLAPLFGHDLGDLPPIVSRQLSAMRRYNALPTLASIDDLPCMVMTAKHDPIAPPQLGLQLKQSFKRHEYWQFDEASHGLPITHAEKVNRILLDWLNQVGAAA